MQQAPICTCTHTNTQTHISSLVLGAPENFLWRMRVFQIGGVVMHVLARLKASKHTHIHAHTRIFYLALARAGGFSPLGDVCFSNWRRNDARIGPLSSSRTNQTVTASCTWCRPHPAPCCRWGSGPQAPVQVAVSEFKIFTAELLN